ncbi:MAG: PEP-CTERM system TPR-repeat protein PrsT [Thiohalocapsa sp.]|nr:PEP-CTERM system TPR-repeat protein PrsT [Thiohalocapsa sp.]
MKANSLRSLATAMLLAAPAVCAASDLTESEALWQQGDTATAINHAKDCLQLDPGDIDAKALLGRIYVDAGRPALAEQELRAAIGLGADADTLLEPLADALLAQGKASAILDLVGTIDADSDAKRALVHTLTGDVLMAQSEPSEAVLEYSRALALDATLERAMLGLSAANQAVGNTAAARAAVDEALLNNTASGDAYERLGDLELSRNTTAAAVDAYRKALLLTRAKWRLHYKLALALIANGDPGAAAKHVETLKSVTPTQPPLLMARGSLHLAQGEAKAALNDFEAYLRLLPDNTKALHLAGVAAVQAGLPEKAREYWRRFLAIRPQATEVKALLGRLDLASRNYRAVIEQYEALRGAATADPVLLRMLAEAYAGEQRWDDAVATLRQARNKRPDDPRIAFQLASFLFRKGDLADAQRVVTDGLTLAPDNWNAQILLAEIQIARDDADAAVTLARQLVDQRGADAQLLTLLGRALLAAGSPKEARAALQQALELSPGMPEAAFNLAQAAMTTGDTDQAAQYLGQVLAVDPNNVEATMAMARLERTTGHLDDAIKRLERLLGKRPDALQVRLALALADLARNRIDDGLRVVRAATGPDAQDQNLILLEGRLELAAGRPNAAVEAFEHLAQRYPESADAHYFLASALARVGNPLQARKEFLAGLEIDPNRPQAAKVFAKVARAMPDRQGIDDLLAAAGDHIADGTQISQMRVTAALLAGDQEEAIRLLKQLRRNQPEDAGYVHELLAAYASANRGEDASKLAKDWLADHPDDADAWEWLGHIRLRRQDRREATASYRQALARDPNRPMANNNLAMLLLADGDARSALALAQTAHRQLPDNADIADTLGTALLATGQTQQALAVLQTAHERSPANASIAYRYAKALVRSGDIADARTLLQTILPQSFAERDEALALLRSLPDS